MLRLEPGGELLVGQGVARGRRGHDRRPRTDRPAQSLEARAGRRDVKLLYFRSKAGNFGDDLNTWLWPRLFPGCFDDDDSEVFVGIGTILDQRVPARARRKIVFGAGVRTIGAVPRIDSSWDVRFVRGPLSSLALGSNPPWITDGAICLKLLDWGEVLQSPGLLLAPHFHTVRDHSYLLTTALDGVRIMDPRGSPETVISEIRRSSAVIAESLHAAIVADLFRIPWVRVNLHSWTTESPEVGTFKWLDWGFSMSVDVQPLATLRLPRRMRRLSHALSPVHRRLARARLMRLVRRCQVESPFRLSRDEILAERVERSATAAEVLRRELRR